MLILPPPMSLPSLLWTQQVLLTLLHHLWLLLPHSMLNLHLLLPLPTLTLFHNHAKPFWLLFLLILPIEGEYGEFMHSPLNDWMIEWLIHNKYCHCLMWQFWSKIESTGRGDSIWRSKRNQKERETRKCDPRNSGRCCWMLYQRWWMSLIPQGKDGLLIGWFNGVCMCVCVCLTGIWTTLL